jgi:rod shape-determining protein MreD
VTRTITAAALIFIALIVQVTMVNRLPFAAVPDVVLVVVIALAVLHGPVPGAVIGFFAGFAADLLPPSHHLIGQYALVMCVTGFVAGRGAERAPFLTAALCAILAPGLGIGIGALLGDPGIDWQTVRFSWPRMAAANLIAVPIVVWAVTALHRGRRGRATSVPAWGRR